jgi:hypothetical protein
VISTQSKGECLYRTEWIREIQYVNSPGFDPIIIQIGKRLFQNDTAQFLFESSKQIKRVEITVENVK